MAANNQPYGPSIRNAINSGDILKMQVLLSRSKIILKEFSNLVLLTFELENSINKIEKEIN